MSQCLRLCLVLHELVTFCETAGYRRVRADGPRHEGEAARQDLQHQRGLHQQLGRPHQGVRRVEESRE